MTCEHCSVGMVKRETTVRAPYRYPLSGLTHLRLAGIAVFRCPACGDERPVIPRIGELHRVVARLLVRKPGRLTAEEIRFLRKHAGFPGYKFAKLLGVSPAYLSRVENRRRGALSATADRLARAISVAATDGEATREALLQLADQLGRKVVARPVQLPLFRLTGNAWRKAA
jgi:transcriptional regulator with XRE-family HTH domain